MNLVNLLEAHSREHPDQIALVEGKSPITFSKLTAQAARAGKLLNDAGLDKGDSVLFLHHVSIAMYIALLGCFRTGISATFIDVSAAQRVLSSALRIQPVKAAFLSLKGALFSVLKRELRSVKPCWCTKPFPGTKLFHVVPEPYDRFSPPLDLSEDHPALITFTTGTTGQPKGICRSHGFLLNQHEALRDELDHTMGEVDLITLPVFTLSNLASGITSVIADTNLQKPGYPNGKRIQAQALRFPSSRCAASPAFYEALQRQKTLPAFTKVFAGGAPVFPSLMKQLRNSLPEAKIYTVYGSSEAEPISKLDYDNITQADLEQMKLGAGLLVGLPSLLIGMKIIDQDARSEPILNDDSFAAWILPVGQTGEIVVTGRHVVPSYIHNNAETLQHKIRLSGSKVWHRTGDAGYLDDQGRLWISGRCKHRFADGLYPLQIETAAMLNFDLCRCAVIERSRESGARLLCVEKRKGQPSPSLTTSLLDDVMPWAGISGIRYVRKIPVDKRHNAKIDYRTLRKLLSYES